MCKRVEIQTYLRTCIVVISDARMADSAAIHVAGLAMTRFRTFCPATSPSFTIFINCLETTLERLTLVYVEYFLATIKLALYTPPPHLRRNQTTAHILPQRPIQTSPCLPHRLRLHTSRRFRRHRTREHGKLRLIQANQSSRQPAQTDPCASTA